MTAWGKTTIRMTGSALLIVLTCGLAVSAAAQPNGKLLTTAVEVRNLSAAEAETALPVRLRGVVTFYDEAVYGRFIADDTAAIYLQEPTNPPPLEAGMLVEVEGVTSAGEFAPIVNPSRITVVGRAPLPDPKPATFQQLATGQEDSQFVQVSGTVRSVRLEETSGYKVLELATGGGRLAVYVKEILLAPPHGLVGSVARVNGVCSTIFNRQRQLFNIRLVVPRATDIQVETPVLEDPFKRPTRPIRSLLQFAPQGSYGSQVKVTGTVSLQQPGTAVYIQNAEDGLSVRTRQATQLEPGDVIEVLGFPAQGNYTPILEDAIYRKLESGPPPTPARVDLDEALKGTYDCRLVRLTARVVDRSSRPGEQSLILSSDDAIFQAHLARPEGEDQLAHIQNGSLVAVTGVCLIDPGSWAAGEEWRAAGLSVLLRSAGDLVLLEAPPWWTLERLLAITGILAAIILAAMTWVAVLRRRVHQQTHIIRNKLEIEEELKERYLDLFENANDMVFTHDLNGRMTSINRAGERLLHKHKAEILAGDLTDLIAPEQREQACKWIRQVLTEPEAPTAEWDFLDAGGRRLRLEVSSRQVDRAGEVVEVEGVARDITQRKRLEREILEISSREQRRIGHDLHDGVCQQLAGISLLTNALADRLEAGHRVNPAEVEKLSALINEANRQTRAVARGLFPVRLEDNGLVSALEELAINASALFNLQCTFQRDEPEPVVEHGIAIHLYYIAQEALANAAKHGQASQVEMELRATDQRWVLRIRDDGVGFSTSFVSRTGMGIRIMHYRARVIGASLDLKSKVGSGTEIQCVFDTGAQRGFPDEDHNRHHPDSGNS